VNYSISANNIAVEIRSVWTNLFLNIRVWNQLRYVWDVDNFWVLLF
jgi:hypothetical protein